MTNAERQAAFQRRKRKRLALCVTPGDVRRAARLNYEAFARENPQENLEPFDAWEAKQRKAKRGGYWGEMMPASADPDDYEGSPEERAFLARVGAVVLACRVPTDADEDD